ncbi:MAG: hypothetical protein JWQ96_262, partial [Segetibacter sp.]|nr:hypothetical protein [Segetibacter sp.]
MAFVYSAANAQTGDSVIVTGEAFIPIEGRAQTPANLAGSWVLTSGLKAKNKEKAKEFYEKKPEPGTETRRDTKTTTAANGETTTEVEYDIIAKPVKQITPRQKSKMHKPEKPSINFFGLNQTFSGFTGCNKISGRYTLSGNKM